MQVFTRTFLATLVREAELSARRRSHVNIHRSYSDPCQRLFNAIGVESYIRPHRHLADPKPETLVAVRGRLLAVVFDDAGSVIQAIRMGSEPEDPGQEIALGVDLSPEVWHTVIAEVPGSIVFEVKPGPFDAHRAKEFANWAPEEGSSDVGAYLARVRNAASLLIAGRLERS